MKEFVIQKNDENQRVDKYLKKLMPNATTSFFYKMMRKKNIVINKKKITGNEKLVAGDVVSIFLSDETFEKFAQDPERIRQEYDYLKGLNTRNLNLVYEDETMILLNKTHNLLSQKSTPSDVSANEYLLAYMIQKGELGLEEYKTFHPSVVNRLDRNTTGLLIFGKTLESLQTLGAALKEQNVGKFYRAICYGELKGALNLKGYLIKDERDNKVRLIDTPEEGAEYINTIVTPLASKNGVTLVEIQITTGKTHQIRLHLSAIGHPILGDMKYGEAEVNKRYYESHKVKHQLLHSYRLTIPGKGEYIAKAPGIYYKFFPDFDEYKG